ncbi:hypothetical protein OXX59_008113, partial [Metschnikowia pulcherrima]
SNGSLPKPKSMLDFGTGDKSPSVRHKDLETKNLLSLEPVKEVITQCETSGEPRSIEPNSEEVKTVNISGKHAENEHPDVRIECDNGQANGQTGNDKLAEFLHEEPLHESDDLQLDSSGLCELGYKIKKHHHLDISNTFMGGTLPRR